MYSEPPAVFAPAPKPKPKDRLRPIGALVTAIVVVAAGIVVVATSSAGDPIFPKKWDPRVAPVAAAVAKLRGLQFQHPVPVKFLEPQEFEKEVGVDQTSVTAEDRAEIEEQAAGLRALGLIGGDVDLLKAVDTAQKSSTLALYSFRNKEILVRGSTLDAQRRVTLAHELVHVLQDQHFDLTKLQRKAYESKVGDTSVFTALVEGDASRTEELYRDKMSAKDKAEYDRADAAEGARVKKESKGVPEIVSFVFGAPYAFGPAHATVLAETGGNVAINRALVAPTPTSLIFIQPGNTAAGVAVPEPVIPAGTKPVGSPTAFGAFELYITLGMYLDANRALHVADGVAGGRQTQFKRGNKVCVKVDLAGERASAEAAARNALQSWANLQPKEAEAKVSTNALGFTACDPGKKASAPNGARFTSLAETLGLRTGLTQGAAQNDLDAPAARCAARLYMTHPDAVAVLRQLGDGQPSPTQQALITGTLVQSARACVQDENAGLP
jgi:hypothetical protein